MVLFPKTIKEKIWKEHLSVYGDTLISYIPEIREIVPFEYHQRLPYRIYLCPLCLKNYFINTNNTNAGIIGNSEFSLDHLPPQSVGGRHTVLTCKKCNNDSGIFEAELEKILNFAVDKTKTNAGISLKVHVVDKETGTIVPGLALSKNGKTDIQFHENLKKYSKKLADFFDRLHSKKAKELTVQIPLFDDKKIGLALLKSAYLLCFVWWGYEFVFSENGALIRDVIEGKKDYPCQVPLNWLEKEKTRPTGISIMQDGNERIAFLVDINLKGIEVNTTATILIPSPTKDGWAKMSLVNEINKANQIKAFTCISLPRIVHRIGYSISWNIVIPPPNQNATL